MTRVDVISPALQACARDPYVLACDTASPSRFFTKIATKFGLASWSAQSSASSHCGQPFRPEPSALVLDNVDNTISGSGQISINGLNGAAGIIDAKGTSGLFLPRTTLTNAGLLENTGTGGLQLGGASITASGSGTLQAVGAGAHVDLDGASIVGGTLRTAGGGVIESAAGSSTLDGTASVVVNTGTLAVSSQTTLYINGTITNTGTIATGAAGLQTALYVGQAGAVLQGGGHITMTADSDNTIGVQSIPQFPSQVLSIDNVNNTLSGGGGFPTFRAPDGSKKSYGRSSKADQCKRVEIL